MKEIWSISLGFRFIYKILAIVISWVSKEERGSWKFDGRLCQIIDAVRGSWDALLLVSA